MLVTIQFSNQFTNSNMHQSTIKQYIIILEIKPINIANMKFTKLFSIAFLMICGLVSYQVNATNIDTNPEIGDRLLIQSPENTTYTAVNMPKLNFVVKKGGVANYKSVQNTLVEVVKISQNKKGENIVTLQRVDGAKILGLKKSVSANYDQALQIGELKKA